jgi:hypothetical protein
MGRSLMLLWKITAFAAIFNIRTTGSGSHSGSQSDPVPAKFAVRTVAMSQKVSTLESTRGAGSNSRLGVSAENGCQAPCSRGDALDVRQARGRDWWGSVTCSSTVPRRQSLLKWGCVS